MIESIRRLLGNGTRITLVFSVVTGFLFLLPLAGETPAEVVLPPLPASDLVSELVVAPAVENVGPEEEVYACGMRLLTEAGRAGKGAEKLPALYQKHSGVAVDDVEFLEYLMSIIYVESRFNKQARSERDAIGLMQMTLPAVQDAVTHCNLRPIGDMDHLYDSATNIRYGSCYLRKVLQDVDGDWTRALIVYNGGYKQLQRYDKGDTIVTETANYVLLVTRALNKICRNNMRTDSPNNGRNE